MWRQAFFSKYVDDRNDKWVFIGSFVSGTVLIVLLRVLSIPLPFVVLVPLGILVAYTAYVMSTARLSMSMDRAGDNLYYLGLLFTLVSLSFSLWKVFAVGGNANAVLDLLSGFGIALVSTIAGMVLRVFVQQFRNDPGDIEKEVRTDLAEAVRTLRAELYAMTADFNSYRRAMGQSVVELQQELLQSTRVMVEASAESIKKTSADLLGTSKGLTTAGERQTAILNSAVTKFESAITDLIQKVDAIEIDASLISSRFENAAALLDGAADQMTKRSAVEAKAAAALGSLVDEVKRLTSSLASADPTSAISGVAGVTADLETASAALKILNVSLGDSSRRLSEMLSKHVAEIEGLLTKLRGSAELAAAYTSEVQHGLVGSVRVLRAEMDR